VNHDELFKEMLLNFFPEFLRLFFPAEAAQLALDQVRFVSPETFTDFPDGAVRRADVVAEVRTLVGETGVILVHVEVQAARDPGMPSRMWGYFSALRNRYGRLVFPVVVYLAPGAGGVAVEEYNEVVLGRRVLRLEYAVVGLPDLSAAQYEALGVPLATALASLMRPTPGLDPVERKYQSLRSVAGADGYDEARRLVLATLVQRYQRLRPADERALQDRLREEEPQAMSIYTIIREEGKEEGIEQGIEQGVVRGLREALLRQMSTKFGPLPESVTAKVNATEGRAELEVLLLRVLTAASLDEMGLGQ
jgi:hypothetical protein